MNRLSTSIILFVAYLAVYFQTSFNGLRGLVGAQFFLLPVLVVYAGLKMDFATVILLALVGGLAQDALSANPLGLSILPLAIAGWLVIEFRARILREESYTQTLVAFLACLGVQGMVFIELILMGSVFDVTIAIVWKWIASSLMAGALTPLFFALFGKLDDFLNYKPLPETTFRKDREIKRGR